MRRAKLWSPQKVMIIPYDHPYFSIVLLIYFYLIFYWQKRSHWQRFMIYGFSALIICIFSRITFFFKCRVLRKWLAGLEPVSWGSACANICLALAINFKSLTGQNPKLMPSLSSAPNGLSPRKSPKMLMCFSWCLVFRKICKMSVSDKTESSDTWEKDPFLLIIPQASLDWQKLCIINAKNTKLVPLMLLFQEATSALVKENWSQCAVDKNKFGSKLNPSWKNTVEA